MISSYNNGHDNCIVVVLKYRIIMMNNIINFLCGNCYCSCKIRYACMK